MAVRMGVEVDPARIEEFLVEVFFKNREISEHEATEGGSVRNTEQAWVQYLKARSVRNTIRTRFFADHGGSRKKMEVINNQSIQILGRGEMQVHIAQDSRKIRVSKKDFVNWMTEQNMQSRPVLDASRTHFDAVEIKVTIGGGTQWASIGREQVIEMPVPEGSPFEESLVSDDEADPLDDPSA